MSFPATRMRRLRQNPILRTMLTEHGLRKSDLIQPLFVKEGLQREVEIPSMPGQKQWAERSIVTHAQRLRDMGIASVLLFGIPKRKDLAGKHAHASQGVLQRAIRAIKRQVPGLLVIADVCLCEYLSHGHCGLVNGDQAVDNDKTLPVLAKIALSYAEAGADAVAPSDMMDGRIGHIRRLLDKKGHTLLPILSYAVKYASAFYGPFRDAAESAPGFGDRSGYQMNPANARDAYREAQADIEEGADMLIVKPALAYGDIIRALKDRIHLPIGAYSVSGEYSMIKAAAHKKFINEQKVVYETHISLKRAGSKFIISYFSADLIKWRLV